MTLCVETDNKVTVNMGVPVFEPERIPLIAGKQNDTYEIDLDGTTVNIAALALGNPHAVQIVANVDNALS